MARTHARSRAAARPSAPPAMPPAPGGQPAETAALAWRDMRRLVLELHERRQQACAAVGLSFSRIKSLQLLAGEPMTLRELARRLAADPPYVTLIARDLEGRGLLRRSVHPHDRRARMLSLTPAGRRTLARAQRVLDEPPAALSALGSEELATLAGLLARLVRESGGPATP